jgi:hypothetical protein
MSEGTWSKKVLERVQGTLKKKIEKTSHRTRPRESKPADEDVVGSLPTAMKQAPLYLFCKMVAGYIGNSDIRVMFDLSEIVKETDTVTMMSLHHMVVSSIVRADTHMKQCLRRLQLREIDFTEEIVKNPLHPIYHPFVELTAHYYRNSLTTRPRAQPSFKEILVTQERQLHAENNMLRVLKDTYCPH